MKLNLKMIAIAAAMASMAGAAHADLTPASSGNGSLVVWAFNTVTRDYYVRDTGFLMNDFLPSSYTAGAADGGVTGNKTPSTGLLLNAGNTASFSDASFATWLAGETATGTVYWGVSAADSVGTAVGGGPRAILASGNASQAGTNSGLTNYVASGNAGGMPVFFGTPGVGVKSVTGTGALGQWDTNFALGTAASLIALDSTANLYLFVKSAGLSGVQATKTEFGNAAGFATVSLASNGDFTYSLGAESVSAVPVPAAAWLLGSGLMGIGGMIRRRKAAAQA